MDEANTQSFVDHRKDKGENKNMNSKIWRKVKVCQAEIKNSANKGDM